MDAVLAQSARQSARSLLPPIEDVTIPISMTHNNLTKANGAEKEVQEKA
jgi:hypothetical protein